MRQRLHMPAHERAQPPAHLVPHHRAAHGPAHHESRPRRAPATRDGPAGARSGGDGRSGCRLARQRRSPLAAASGPPREAQVTSLVLGRGNAGQTLTRARPLRRRAARIARPALVRMRSLNPCVLARRRLFGWNVRLLTGNSRYRSGLGPREGDKRACGIGHRGSGWVCSRYAHPRPPVKPAEGCASARTGGLPNARRARPLGCGQRSGRGWPEPGTRVPSTSTLPARSVHSAISGVHNLWTKLLITPG